MPCLELPCCFARVPISCCWDTPLVSPYVQGFVYMYSLQVGVAIISACGFTLMTTAVLVNISFSVRSNPEDQDSSVFETLSQFVVFVVFVSLGYVAFCFALMGAYKEEVTPLKIALSTLIFQFCLWLALTTVSFLPYKTLAWTCVQGIRCGDRFFIHSAYFRKAQEDPEYSFNYRTDENPHKVFALATDCQSYCQTSLILDSTTTTTEANNTTGRTSTTMANIAKIAPDVDSTTITTSANVTKIPPFFNSMTTANVTNIDPDDNSTFIVTATNKTARTTISVPIQVRMMSSRTESTKGYTELGPETRAPRDRQRCNCHRVKKEISTLIGDETSTSHLVLAVIYSIIIAFVWYLHCFCILGSYINFLENPPQAKGLKLQKSNYK